MWGRGGGGVLRKALKMNARKNENKLVAILSGGRAQPVPCAKLQSRAIYIWKK